MTDLYPVMNYLVVVLLMVSGLYIVIASSNLVKKIVGLNIFQASVFILYISMGKILGGTAPILDKQFSLYSAPLPHVLILTAIVVGVATTALGLALIARIREAYNTIEEDVIRDQEVCAIPEQPEHHRDIANETENKKPDNKNPGSQDRDSQNA